MGVACSGNALAAVVMHMDRSRRGRFLVRAGGWRVWVMAELPGRVLSPGHLLGLHARGRLQAVGAQGLGVAHGRARLPLRPRLAVARHGGEGARERSIGLHAQPPVAVGRRDVPLACGRGLRGVGAGLREVEGHGPVVWAGLPLEAKVEDLRVLPPAEEPLVEERRPVVAHLVVGHHQAAVAVEGRVHPQPVVLAADVALEDHPELAPVLDDEELVHRERGGGLLLAERVVWDLCRGE
mmetsp:Transcript_26203/g.87787  ORF Transcript_26203/g.87787 Transcript_26203/m.87787 type:complete len:238 (-) Transcript_26203:322-1035(-)